MSPDRRVDIQALRALAVTLVVVFHLAPNRLPGGYIGVDVFFVLSGFLITAHLLREITRTGRISLSEFWARRARRLLPAAFLVLAVSAVAVWLFLPAPVMIQNFTEIAFAGVYILNWRLAADSVDYLAAGNAHSIAQHYWSLSVEEQFYLVWPLLIMFAVWILTRRLERTDKNHECLKQARKNAVFLLLVIIFAASLGFSIYATAVSQPNAYFITTTRVWEFALGGLVALLPLATLPRFISVTISWAALLAILASAYLFTENTQFPGAIALIPVLGTAALIWVGDGVSQQPWSPQFFGRNRIVQFLGDVSYSVYLWHWPLIVTVAAVLGHAPGLKWAVVIIIATLLLAAATKYWVEDPVRRAGRILRKKSVTYGLMLTGIAGLTVITLSSIGFLKAQADAYVNAITVEAADEKGCFGAYAVLNHCEDPFAYTSLVNPQASKEDTPPKFLESSTECEVQKVRDSAQYRCEVEPADPQRTVMLVGDSHAYSLFPGFAAASKEHSWRFSMRARPLCPAYPGAKNGQSDVDSEACSEWTQEVRDEILNNESIDVVVFASVETEYPDGRQQATLFFDELRESGKEVVLFRRVPGAAPGVVAPTCIASSQERVSPCSYEVAQQSTWVFEAARSAELPMINPWEVLCHDGRCETVIGGAVLYLDNNHLTPTFARTLAPWIGLELEGILSRSDS